MARVISAGSKDRPAVQSIKSFTRFDPEPSKPARLRASTVGSASAEDGDGTSYAVSPGRASQVLSPVDLFDKKSQVSPMPELEQSLSRAQSLPARLDELPVELASSTDR